MPLLAAKNWNTNWLEVPALAMPHTVLPSEEGESAA
jgi:hypothetical protein